MSVYGGDQLKVQKLRYHTPNNGLRHILGTHFIAESTRSSTLLVNQQRTKTA